MSFDLLPKIEISRKSLSEIDDSFEIGTPPFFLSHSCFLSSCHFGHSLACLSKQNAGETFKFKSVFLSRFRSSSHPRRGPETSGTRTRSSTRAALQPVEQIITETVSPITRVIPTRNVRLNRELSPNEAVLITRRNRRKTTTLALKHSSLSLYLSIYLSTSFVHTSFFLVSNFRERNPRNRRKRKRRRRSNALTSPKDSTLARHCCNVSLAEAGRRITETSRVPKR